MPLLGSQATHHSAAPVISPRSLPFDRLRARAHFRALEICPFVQPLGRGEWQLRVKRDTNVRHQRERKATRLTRVMCPASISAFAMVMSFPTTLELSSPTSRPREPRPSEAYVPWSRIVRVRAVFRLASGLRSRTRRAFRCSPSRLARL